MAGARAPQTALHTSSVPGPFVSLFSPAFPAFSAPVKLRSLAPQVATLLCVLGGMLIGYTAGVAAVFYRAGTHLEQQAATALSSADDASREAIAALAKIDSSSYPSCSPQEITFFRSLIFNSRFLKDAGHMFVRTIDCSSMLGRLATPIPVPEPDFTSPAGAHIFRALPDPVTGGTGIYAAQLGNAYVVFSPWIFTNPAIDEDQFTVTVRDRIASHSGPLFGGRPSLPLQVVAAEGHGTLSGLLYATRCSKARPICTTAYKPVAKIVAQERTAELVDSGLGGLAGLTFSMLWSLASRHNRSLERQLRRAIKHDQFRMLYQPQVDIATGTIVGAEALIRWNNEQGTAVSPDTFIPLAEELGIIREITQLVVRHVLQDLGETLSRDPAFSLSINVSPADLLDPAFSTALKTSLHAAGVCPRSLAIEVTETSMGNGEEIAAAVRALRRAGFSVHLDDFGTGYSNLARLQELEIDTIKIDRAFIRAIGTGSVAQGVLQQIVAMAEYLNLKIILEGVETREQADYFIATGKPLVAQGWYFGRPAPPATIKAAIAERHASAPTPAPAFNLEPQASLIEP